MQRVATRQSRGPNAEEKRHIGWIKERGECAACGAGGGVIAHHCAGSTAKVRVGFERVMIGHWFVIGLCQPCDDLVTLGSRRAFTELFGPQSDLWLRQSKQYRGKIPASVSEGIIQWGK